MYIYIYIYIYIYYIYLCNMCIQTDINTVHSTHPLQRILSMVWTLAAKARGRLPVQHARGQRRYRALGESSLAFLPFRVWGLGVEGFRGYGARGLEVRGSGFRGFGFKGLGFRGLQV